MNKCGIKAHREIVDLLLEAYNALEYGHEIVVEPEWVKRVIIILKAERGNT